MYTENLSIQSFDEELWSSLENEKKRQEEHIELIASENYTSPRVLEAQGSVLTNKYAEGYPGKRYYGGCEFVDVAEQLAIDRAKELGYEYVFISIELFLRRRSLIDIIKYLENKYSYKWLLEDKMFNTCRQHNDKGDYIGLNPSHKCYQNVCYTQIVDKPLNPFTLPSISMDDYKKVHSKMQYERLKD